MDPLSHGLVGAVSALLICRKTEHKRAAATYGLLAGMSPDLDVLIRSSDNPMLGLAYHRHFTHALAFSPILAGLNALVLGGLRRGKEPFFMVFGFCWIAVMMHGMLDAMTNYGTHLFWPFTERRESWSIISIIDPIFTLTLFLLVFLALRLPKRWPVYAAVLFAFTYWGAGLYQREQATQAMMQLAQSRGHQPERFEVKPSIGNLLLWRTQYEYRGQFYIDALHQSPWRGQRWYAGGALPRYSPPVEGISPVQQKDFEFFSFFSDGWVAMSPSVPDLVGDVRFSMLPNQREPIWGIRFRPDAPEKHVLFLNTRSRREGDAALLWSMILGEPPAENSE